MGWRETSGAGNAVVFIECRNPDLGIGALADQPYRAIDQPFIADLDQVLADPKMVIPSLARAGAHEDRLLHRISAAVIRRMQFPWLAGRRLQIVRPSGSGDTRTHPPVPARTRR